MGAPRLDYAEEARRTEVYSRLGETKEAADELGIRFNTFRTWIRGAKARAKAASRPVEEVIPPPPPGTRALQLQADLHALMTRGRYPLVNVESIVVETRHSRRYVADTGEYDTREAAPRTWLSETLQVAPIKDSRNRTFLFTGAQNDAAIHAGFWRNLQAYAAHLDAEIVIGPWTYETQWWSENNPASRAYAPELEPHLCFGQLAVGDKFVFCGEMNTLPTATKPISDLKTYSRGRWAVFPHAKVQLDAVPVTGTDSQAHHVMTTGAVTRPKVIPRKAGVKSLFEHEIGCVIVEFDEDGDLFCRHIIAEADGSFQDLDVKVRSGRVTIGHRVRAMVCGDAHVAKIDREVSIATWGYDPKTGAQHPGSIYDELRPSEVVLHDVHDHESRNHHHKDDNYHFLDMSIRGRGSVLGEISKAAAFLGSLKRPWSKLIVVESNHDRALDRWVDESRYLKDGENLETGLDLAAAKARAVRSQAAEKEVGKHPTPWSMLEYAIRKLLNRRLPHVVWAYVGGSRKIEGIEVGQHGDLGINGAPSSNQGFVNLGTKQINADKHTAFRQSGEGCVGVCQTLMGYNKGPSSWSVTHAIIYPNGKWTHMTLQKGKWRAARRRKQERLAA